LLPLFVRDSRLLHRNRNRATHFCAAAVVHDFFGAIQGHLLLPDVIRDEQLCFPFPGRGIYVVGIVVGSVEAGAGFKALAGFALRLEHGIGNDSHGRS